MKFCLRCIVEKVEEFVMYSFAYKGTILIVVRRINQQIKIEFQFFCFRCLKVVMVGESFCVE